MSEKIKNDADTSNASTKKSNTTPGTLLIQARERCGINVVQVAEHLRLTVAVIESLESDDYESLPPKPFVMGYLRAYARLVEIDAEEVIDELNEYLGLSSETAEVVMSSQEAAAEEIPEISKAKTLFTGKVSWIIGAVVVLVIVSSSLWHNSDEDWRAAPSSAGDAEITKQAVTSTPLSIPEVKDAAVPAEPEPDNNTTSGSAEKTQSKPALKNEELKSSGMSTATSLDQLYFSFVGECWLEVTDSNGDVVAVDLYQAGSEVSLQGTAPFAVTLGNYHMAQVTLNGEAVELRSNGTGNTLRTTLGSQVN